MEKEQAKEQTKNMTVALPLSVHEDLDNLIQHFQKQSVSLVTKSDVIRYLIKRYGLLVQNQGVDKVQQIIQEELNYKEFKDKE